MAPEQRRITGSAKLIRGALAAMVAVGAAVLAHVAAGHQAPHAVVILLAVTVSVPLCVQLSGVTLSRARLVAAVLSSQAALHILFALFPASSAGSSGLVADSHTHHVEAALLPFGGTGASNELAVSPAVGEAVHSSVPGIAAQTGSSMLATHLMAAALAYLLLRRGEVLLHAIAKRLVITPVLILLERQPAPHSAPRRIAFSVRHPENEDDAWLGSGPRSLRGPPALVT
ncbi:hypothetical protein [Nesterenkonia muleiensis]|uniref:hypothetical protein n=1 Tax=Nesterenkonia muleiensis TaxID=2282648 RepID=UPI000E711E61|nr:hypothetical protein [Nesterenkonia muleiensis]